MSRAHRIASSKLQAEISPEGAELQQLVEGAELRLRREEAVCRMPRRADAGPTPPPAAR